MIHLPKVDRCCFVCDLDLSLRFALSLFLFVSLSLSPSLSQYQAASHQAAPGPPKRMALLHVTAVRRY